MFTSEMESMLAILMLIPTMTGGPEVTQGKLMSPQKYKMNYMQLLYLEITFTCTKQTGGVVIQG